MAFSNHSVPTLFAATLLATFMVAGTPAVAQGPRNAAEFAAYCSAQGLGVAYNPPRCVAAPTSTAAPASTGADPRAWHLTLSWGDYGIHCTGSGGVPRQADSQGPRRCEHASTGPGVDQSDPSFAMPSLVPPGYGTITGALSNEREAVMRLYEDVYASSAARNARCSARSNPPGCDALFRAFVTSIGAYRSAVEAYQAHVRQAPGQACASTDPQLAIAACGTMIASGRFDAQNLAVLLSNRGFAYYRQRDYARGLADFNEALRLNPQSAAAHNGLGHIYSSQGDNARAIASYEAALRIEPQSAAAQVGRDRAAAQLNARQPATAAGGQTNAGALTAEARAISADAPRSAGGSNANGALQQLVNVGTGATTVGRSADGGTAHDDGRATGTIVSPPIPTPVHATRVLSAAELNRYNGVRGFAEAQRAVEAAGRASEQAEARRADLTRQASLATEAPAQAQVQAQLREAEQAARAARGAHQTAGNRREEIINLSINATLNAPPGQ